MEAVKVWGFSMCTAVVIGSITIMIVPSIEKQRIMKLVISAFVLAGVISPLLNVIDEMDISAQALSQDTTSSGYIQLDDNTLEELENNVSQALFPLVQDEFEKMNISNEFGIVVELSQKQDGISVKCVNIWVADLHIIEKENLKILLEENLGLDVNIESGLNGENTAE